MQNSRLLVVRCFRPGQVFQFLSQESSKVYIVLSQFQQITFDLSESLSFVVIFTLHFGCKGNFEAFDYNISCCVMAAVVREVDVSNWY